MEKEHLSIIEEAIKGKKAISFKYLKPNDQLTIHNAVYPKEIFQKESHIFFKAYCHFTRDTRFFRIDRGQSLQLASRRLHLTRRDIIGAILFFLGIFLFFLFFSQKYRWRNLRNYLSKKLGIK